MQKVPTLLKVRQEQGKVSSIESSGKQSKKTGICALLSAKKNSSRLYNSVVENEYGGQEKYTINTF